MKSPFAQALDHRYDLTRLIRKQPGWEKRRPFVVHAVCFPDITVHQLALAPDAPQELIIDRFGARGGEIAKSIQRVLAYHRGKRENRSMPGAGGAEMLRSLLAADIRIEVPMAEEFMDEYEELVTLTQSQAEVLRRLAKARRLAVRGCAGSGKTMLAVERAKRLAAEGKDVLLVCFNKALRAHLRRTEGSSGVEFWNFHALCVHWAHRAEVELPDFPDGEAPQDYWDEDLPLALIEAMEKKGPQYDALFVDEAQDLRNDWLEALLAMLREPEKDPVWLFLDDNQKVYDQQLDVPPEYTPVELDVNCRNTRAIHKEVIKKYRGEIEPKAIGPKGRDVELYRTDHQPATVAEIIERLCGREEVPPQDIVVLSAHNVDNSEVGASKPGRFELVKEPQPVGPYIRFSSIRGFKGLESPAVILCELEDIDEATLDQQLYVGMSRARNYCAVVAPKATSKKAMK